MSRPVLVFALAAALSPGLLMAATTVYKSKNADGTTVYSQIETRDAQAQRVDGRDPAVDPAPAAATLPRAGIVHRLDKDTSGLMVVGKTLAAVTGLTRSLGLDGRAFNIACGQIDIGNALTDMSASQTKGVPQADGSIRAEPMMDVAHVASSVLHMAGLPAAANVQFMTVMATAMPYIGRG